MSIQLNANLKIAAPAPIDQRYLSLRTLCGSPLPYSANTEVYATIPLTERYTGLTVNINNLEYWFKNNTTTLILKSITGQTTANAVTGATNLGFFSGKTGIQTLPITNLPCACYNGTYNSIYNNYYRSADAIIHTGTPSDGIPKRGYVKSAFPTKSWIWNESTCLGNLLGWILVDGDVSQQIGCCPPVYTYYGTSTSYVQTSWTTGIGYNNGSCLVISTVTGCLTTGTTITIGGPPYAKEVNQALEFRTLISDTPSNLAVSYDESFIHLSGVTPIVMGANIGTGIAVLKSPVTGTTLQFRRLQGSGSTVVNQVGDSVIITTIVSGSTSGVTNAVNIGTGTGLFKTKVNNCLQFRSLVPSGNTSISQVGYNVIIYSSGGCGGGTYNLSSPAAITVGGISCGTVLTGKTSFQLFEELLVPELCGSITPPSIGIGLTASGLYEIGCSLSQTVTGNFNRGCINPQYCSVCAQRSGPSISYCFTGCGMPSGFQACSALSASETNPSYTVIISTQSWGVCNCYNNGCPALGSKGTQYCTALPAGCTSPASNSIVGVYPLYGTTSNITTLTKQALQNMSTANCVQINLVADSSPNKQKFEIPCAWLGAPTSRPLVGIQQYNTVSAQWEYPGGCASCSLVIWTCSASVETIQGNPIGYCQYTYNGVDRSAVCIRLVF
jgi:hypothetical protein